MIPKFRKLVPRLIKKMKVVISGGFKSEYNVGGVPDPFLQVEMLKLLCLLATNDHDCSDMLGDLLAFPRLQPRQIALVWLVMLFSMRL